MGRVFEKNIWAGVRLIPAEIQTVFPFMVTVAAAAPGICQYFLKLGYNPLMFTPDKGLAAGITDTL